MRNRNKDTLGTSAMVAFTFLGLIALFASTDSRAAVVETETGYNIGVNPGLTEPLPRDGYLTKEDADRVQKHLDDMKENVKRIERGFKPDSSKPVETKKTTEQGSVEVK